MEARIDAHPPHESLKAFGLGLLDDASAQVLYMHLEGCPACRRQAEVASGDDFLARLQRARDFNATPAPARPLPGSPKGGDWPSTIPPNPAKSLAPGMSVHLQSTVSDLPPELVGNSQYEVIRELGRGGMGVVYLAQNRPMDRLEVLKVVNRTLLERPGIVERFLREIRSAAKLKDKNIVRAYACLQTGDLLALVMEYVKGENLADLVERRGPLSVSSACSSAIQAARGLQEAHTQGLVHRDIKPHNLILSLEIKQVMILDFGLAKVASEKGIDEGLTGSGQMLGTPGYIAPEQILDATAADIRADIYSLGCTLYFLLSGRPPFQADSLYELLRAHQFVDARPLNEERPNVPSELAAVVGRMMAKDPAQRYQTPVDVVAALTPFVKGAESAPLAIPLVPERKTTRVADSVAEGKSKPGTVPTPKHGLSVWDNLTEPDAPPDTTAVVPDCESSPVAKPASKRRWLIGATIATAVMLLGLVGLMAGGVFKVKTKEGILVVEVNEPNPEVFVDGEKVTVTWGKDGKKAEISVKPGTRKVQVKKDGFTTVGQEVTLDEGGREVFTARFQANPKQKEPMAKESPKEVTNSIGMKLAYIPAGEFMMGSPEEDKEGSAAERPRHPVRITKAFYLGIHEVTQKQFKAVMGYNPSHFSRDGEGKKDAVYAWKPAGGKNKIGEKDDPDNFPVENVSWEEAREYCEKLSAMKKEKDSGHVYRLPTEAEWEYACRGGDPSYKLVHVGDKLTSPDANFGNNLKRACKVGSYKPNAFGLFDMYGNVWEWCSDWYDKDYYAASPIVDPFGGTGSERVGRGGSWDNHGREIRSAVRSKAAPAYRAGSNGFRVLLSSAIKELPPSPTVPADANGFVPLFNGKDLKGWKVYHRGKDDWEVVGGMLTRRGAPSYLYTEREDYANFHLRVEARINEGGNSGLYFRAPFTPAGPFPGSLETDISFMQGSKTGTLHELPLSGQCITTPVQDDWIKPGVWFVLETRIEGTHVVTWIDGKKVVDLHRSVACRKRGAIALQHLGASTAVEFRKVEIKELAESSDLPPLPDRTVEAHWNRELLQNPGCEEPMVNGRIPGWVVVQGKWIANRRGNYAKEGTAIFYATNSRTGELGQDIDLRKIANSIDGGKVQMEFSGYVRSADQRPSDVDSSQIVIEYRDGENDRVLSNFDSGRHRVVKEWKRITEGRVLPKGTRWVRVRLISVLYGFGRGARSNDGYYDDLSLKLKLRE